MTGSDSKSAISAESLLLKALIISVAIHLAAFGGWKWSQTHSWWKRLALPAWMEVGRNHFISSIAKKLPPSQRPQQVPMLYVDVDPALAAAQPPPNPKFYSSADSLAANPEKKIPSDVPQISGTQDKVMKTIAPSAKSFPLQPAPPKPESTEIAEAKPTPKPSYTPGDLVVAKPGAKMLESKGTAESDQGLAEQAQPKHERPRTLAEARERQGIPGAKTRQNGGVNRLEPDSMLDAMKTPYGEYDRDFIEAVRARWYDLLENRQAAIPGKVQVEFNLHADGRITDMKMTANEVNELLAELCERAVLDPAPFKPWPQKMRQEIPDPRQIRFTFYYENE
jgi:outer membrane biosynthesis protein TonB